MDFGINIEKIEKMAIQDDGKKMSYFLKVVLPTVLDQSLIFFFIAALCNYFFWKIVSFIFTTDYNSAIGSFCFFLFLFSLIHAAVRAAQAYSMLDFLVAEQSNYAFSTP